MLYDEPILQYRGLTIFKDFSDTRTFYYLPPEAPRIARSAEGGEGGDYALRLVLFRPDPNGPKPQGMEDGGGFLNLDTDLHISEGLRQDAEQEIRRKFGTDANLVPVPFIDGSVELVLLGTSRDDEAQPFVRKVAGSTVPALYGTQRAAFSTVLDRNGAALMRAVLEEGGAMMALAIYHLTYAGIGPAYNLKITVDFQRVYEHLDLRLNASVSAGNSKNKLVAKAGFHMLMEELKESRAIKVEEVDPIPGENGRTPTNQEAINEIIGNLMGSKWFKPTLGTGPTMTALAPPAGGPPAATPAPPAAGPTPPAGTPPAAPAPAGGAGRSPAAAPPPGATGATPAPAPQPVRQAATWNEDPPQRPPDFPPERGVEAFQASASGDQETLVVRGEGASATVDGHPAALQGNRLVVPAVAAGAAAHNVVITWPGQPRQEDTFHLFFDFDQPENDAERDAYATGTPPAPGDQRFVAASQSKSAPAGSGVAALEAWLDRLAGNRIRIDGYASWERDPSDAEHNMALSQRRATIAARLIDARRPARGFTTSDAHPRGHDPAAAGGSAVPTIAGNGDAPDGHGANSLPAHRVAVITGLLQEQRAETVLRGRLSRAASTTPTIPTTPPRTDPPRTDPPRPGEPPKKKEDDPMTVQASFEVNLEIIEREEKITASYELNTRKARKQQIHPQGQLMLDAIDPARYILEADGAIDFFQWLEIAASTTAQWALDGIHSIQVQLRYAPSGEPGGFQRSGEIMLTPEQPTGQWKSGVLHENDDAAAPVVYWYEYKVIVNYTQDVALGHQQGAVTSAGTPRADADGWIRGDARNLVIHPRDVTPAVTVNVSTGVMQYDLLTKAQLVLTYGPYRQNLELSADRKEHRLVIRPDPELEGASLRTEGLLFYKDGAQVPLPPQEWKPQELVVVNEPRENMLRVRVILADPAGEIEQVHVTLRYEHANRIVEQPLVLKDHAEMKEWAVRLEDPARRGWRYEATVIKKSGDIDRIEWTDGRNDQLILGVQAVDVIPVQVTWLLPPPAGELVAVKIDLLYEDAPNEVRWTRSELIRQGHDGTFAWAVPIKDTRRRGYRYKVTEFRMTGQKEGPWIDSDVSMLVLLPGA